MSTKLFVANLGWSVTENDLFNLFSDCGEVISVKIPLRREDGRSRGFAFIEMASEDVATRSIQQLNGMTLYNRPISVVRQDENYQSGQRRSESAQHQRYDTSSGNSYNNAGYDTHQARYQGPEKNNKLFIRNVNAMVSETELERLFQQAGSVLSVKIPTDRETGMARGFAFVEMATADEAEQAIARINGTSVYGQMISVNFQDPSKARTSRVAAY